MKQIKMEASVCIEKTEEKKASMEIHHFKVEQHPTLLITRPEFDCSNSEFDSNLMNDG